MNNIIIEKQIIVLLDTILEKAKKSKKIDEIQRYVDMYIELYINTIGSDKE